MVDNFRWMTLYVNNIYEVYDVSVRPFLKNLMSHRCALQMIIGCFIEFIFLNKSEGSEDML